MPLCGNHILVLLDTDSRRNKWAEIGDLFDMREERLKQSQAIAANAVCKVIARVKTLDFQPVGPQNVMIAEGQMIDINRRGRSYADH